MLCAWPARTGLRGRDSAKFLHATHTRNPLRLQPGLIFDIRRLKGDTVANGIAVRIGPDQRLWMTRQVGDSSWTESVENIPWNAEGLRTTAVIQSNLYDALDAAIPDSFLPARQRVGLAWAIADVYDWEVDFTRDLRPGDRVEVLIERLESPEGERRLGRILAARVDVAGSPSYAFAFDNADGRPGFYADRGRSLPPAFLPPPLPYRHVPIPFRNPP